MLNKLALQIVLEIYDNVNKSCHMPQSSVFLANYFIEPWWWFPLVGMCLAFEMSCIAVPVDDDSDDNYSEDDEEPGLTAAEIHALKKKRQSVPIFSDGQLVAHTQSWAEQC